MNPTQWFLGKPEIIFVVSCGFFIVYLIINSLRLSRRKLSSVRSWSLLIPAVAWLLFAIWEWFYTTKENPIRVDLLLVYPVLIVASIFGLSVSISSLISSFLKK